MIGLLVDCGQPEFPSNGVVSSVSSTTEGATVTFHCEEGVTSTCSSTGLWTPNLVDVQCSAGTTIAILSDMQMCSLK